MLGAVLPVQALASSSFVSLWLRVLWWPEPSCSSLSSSIDTHIHTGILLLVTVSAQLAAAVCGEPAVCHRCPHPTVLGATEMTGSLL